VTILKYAAAALMLLPATAFAADSDTIVVTANGIAQPRTEVGQAITVIDLKTLETQQTSVITDILRTVPSVNIARNGGVGAQSSVFIRGGDSSQTLVLIDGVRINDPSSPNAAFDFGALLTGNIGRVEVLRGPNSVIWGSQAIGGVVNIQTLEPTESLAVNARAEYGYQDTANVQANVSGRTGIISGSIGGGLYRTTGISALVGGTERDGYRNASANGKLKVAFTDNISLDFRGYYNRGEVQFDSTFPLSPNSLPETENEQFLGYVGMNAKLLGGRLTNRLSYTRTDISRIGSDVVRPVNFNVNAIKATLDRFEYHGAFDVVDAAKLVFGVEHERSFASTFFPANGPGTVADRAKTTVTSGFGQLILKPFTGLTLTGGARYDDYSDYGGQTTFGANFAYTPNDGKTLIRGTYAEGFRAPTLTEALLPFGNVALKPETAKSFDVGVEQSLLDGKIVATATYFRRNSRNLITFSFVTFQSENIAKARGEGAEFGLALRPTSNLNVAANFSFVEATSRSQGTFGNRLARRPQENVNLSADWQTPLGLSIGTTITLTGDAFDNLGNTRRLDGYALIGLRVAYSINDRIDLFGRVENLGDENYQTATGFNSLGRNAYVGARVKF
jgi:vitamin B12 transporter